MNAMTTMQPTHDSQDTQAMQERIQQRLRFVLGDAAYNSWFRHVRTLSIEPSCVTIGVPTRFVREWILSHYYDELLECWQQEQSSVLSIEVRIKPALATTSAAPVSIRTPVETPQTNTDTHSESSAAPGSMAIETLPEQEISSPLDPRFTFEQFVVGESNELAYAAARQLADECCAQPGTNPLYFHGGVGLGKTHLMQAIAWEIRRRRPTLNVVYMTAERFMYLFVRALRERSIVTFKEQLRAADILLIDDVQFICGKGSTQEEFFHTFNALLDLQRPLVFSGSRQPGALEGLDERLRSRLSWGLVADIDTADYALRLGVLQTKARRLGCDIPEDVLEFLAQRITSNIRELEGALHKIAAQARFMRTPVTLERAQQLLRDLLHTQERAVTIENIQKAVAQHCSVSLADMRSSRRARHIARSRQMAMYLAKQLTPHSLPEIGKQFGGKDHTTVMHAVRRVEALLTEDGTMREDIERLTRSLQS